VGFDLETKSDGEGIERLQVHRQERWRQGVSRAIESSAKIKEKKKE
jgi:hypothetical protein